MEFDSAAYLRLDAPNSVGASKSGVAFATTTGDLLELACHGPGVFRLRVGAAAKPVYGIVQSPAKPCTVANARPGTWTLSAGETTFEFTGSPLSFRLLRNGVPVLHSITDLTMDGATRLPTIGRLRRDEQWTAAFALASGEAVYGLGEKFGPLNKRGQLIHSQVEDARGVNTGLTSKNTPFVWGSNSSAAGERHAWGVFVHTPGRVAHGVGCPDWSHRSYAVVVDDEALDLFLFAAETPAGILDLYTQLTGRAPGVPQWSLGLWVSRARFDNADAAVTAAAKLRRHRIPCDVLVLGGRSAWNDDTGFNFEWDRTRFPDAHGALSRIRAHHMKVCVSVYPYVSLDAPLYQDLVNNDFVLTDHDGDPCVIAGEAAGETDAGADAAMPLRESVVVDFTNPLAFAWWRDKHGPLFADGIDIINTDCGEHVPDDAIAYNGDVGTRLHNVYPLLYNQCVHEATVRYRPDANVGGMVWGRAGWAGSQRFPIQCGGQAQGDWEGLAASLRGVLSWGMSGAPCCSIDVGGSYGTPDAELYLRWLQAAVFGSHLRIHGAGERDPWMFGAEAEAVARKWLGFRYRLIPYLQQVVGEATRTGLPVMRAMALAFPNNALLRSFETQFMCGDALLVAPIIAAGGEIEIALPPGAWYDLNSRRRFSGQRVLRYKASLDQFPVFGREGHALPLGAAVQHTGEIDPKHPIAQLWVFGRPTQPLDGYALVKIAAGAAGAMAIHASPGVEVQMFGDAEGLAVTGL